MKTLVALLLALGLATSFAVAQSGAAKDAKKKDEMGKVEGM